MKSESDFFNEPQADSYNRLNFLLHTIPDEFAKTSLNTNSDEEILRAFEAFQLNIQEAKSGLKHNPGYIVSEETMSQLERQAQSILNLIANAKKLPENVKKPN